MKAKFIKIVLLSSILLFSCKRDELDFGVVNEFTLSPTVAVPILKTRIQLGDVINEDTDTTIVINPNNSISIAFRDDSIAVLRADELIAIEDQDFYSDMIAVGNLTVGPFSSLGNATLDQILNNVNPPDVGDSIRARDETIDYFPPIPEQSAGSHAEQSFSDFKKVYISSGQMELLVINGLPVDVENLVIAIKNKEDSSEVVSYNISVLPATSNITQSVNLSGAVLSNEVFVELENFRSPGSGMDPMDTSKHVYISTQDQIAFQMTVSELVIDSGEVVLPDQFVQDIADTADMIMDNGEEIELIILKNGQLNYDINSSFQEAIDITFNLPTVSNGTPFTKTVNIPAGVLTSGSIDLTGYEVLLDQDVSQPFNRLPLDVDVSVASTGGFVRFTSLDEIGIDIGVSNLEFEYLQGYFGQQNHTTDPFSTSVDFSFIQELEGDFRFFNPQFRLRVASQIGLPSDIQMDATSYNTATGASAPLNAPFLEVPYPTFLQRGETIRDTLEVNNTNSNIVDFMSLVPDSIAGDGLFRTNAAGNTGETNFAYADSKVAIGLEVEVPLEIAVDGLVLEDKQGIDWGFTNSLEGDNYSLDSVQVNFNIINGFPLAADLELIMEDSLGMVIDTIFLSALQAAPVDSEGRVVNPEEYLSTISLSGTALDDFVSADRIRVRAIINTYGSDVPTKVTLFTDYFIELTMSVKTQVNYTVGNGE